MPLGVYSGANKSEPDVVHAEAATCRASSAETRSFRLQAASLPLYFFAPTNQAHSRGYTECPRSGNGRSDIIESIPHLRGPGRITVGAIDARDCHLLRPRRRSSGASHARSVR